MFFTLVLYMTKKYGEIYSHTFVSNHPNYTINTIITQEIPEKSSLSPNTIFLCDTDKGLADLSHADCPVIAVSHKENTRECLMGTPWMILSPEALTPSFLNEVYCRYHHLPIITAKTKRCILRELTQKDLPFLLTLQSENSHNPDGCFFPQHILSPEEFLSHYIQCQYPFYEYGLFALIEKETKHFLGIAGFSTPAEKDLPGVMVPASKCNRYVEISYALLKHWQGKGYASEAICELIRLSKEKFHFPHVIARIHKNNTASIAVAKKNHLDIQLYSDTDI